MMNLGLMDPAFLGSLGGERDPYFSSVSLLLHGTGTNGSTSIIDRSPSPKTITVAGDAQISTAQSRFGGGSIYVDGAGDFLTATSSDFALGSNNFTIESWVYFPSGFTFSTGMAPFCIDGNTYTDIFTPFSIRTSGGAVQSFIWGTSSWSIASGLSFTTIQRDVWLFWAVTRDGANWSLFENGDVKSTITNSQAISNSTPASSFKFNIGRGFTDGEKDVRCYFNEIRATRAARYAVGTGANAGKMVHAGTNILALPTAPFPDA